jgi:hypothetical protein
MFKRKWRELFFIYIILKNKKNTALKSLEIHILNTNKDGMETKI